MVIEDEEGDWHNLIGDHITEQKAWDKLHKDRFYGFDFDSTMVKDCAHEHGPSRDQGSSYRTY